MAERGRPRSFDRTTVLNRALMAFWRKGYEATSMSDLLAAMGINSPSLYAAYGSKEALFAETVTHYLQCHAAAMLAALNDAPDAASGLTAMFDAAIDLFTDPERPYGCFIVASFAGNAPPTPAVQQNLSRLRRERNAQIADRIQRDISEGRLSPHLPVQALADMYTAILHGMAIGARDGLAGERLSPLYRPAIALLSRVESASGRFGD